jgi:hypothetical protein
MRRNVLQRTYEKIRDWALGVDEDEIENSELSNSLVISMKSFKFNFTNDCKANPWAEFGGLEFDWVKAIPSGPLHGQTMIPVVTLHLRPLLSHLAVWIAAERITEGWTVMVDHNGDEKNPNGHYNGTFFVNSEELKQQFLTWWNVYSKRFPDINMSIPQLKDGMRLDGLLVKSRGLYSGFISDEQHAEWRWIVENCGPAYIVNNDYWLFTEDSDAVLYKLSKES